MINEILNVVVIEDDICYRENLVSLLEEIPFINCVSAFDDAAGGIEHMWKNKDVRLVLLDIGLPAMSGIDAIDEIKKSNPEIDIVMISVFDDDEKIFESLCRGASGYLLKTESEGKFEQSISDVISGGGVFSPSIALKVLNHFRNIPNNEYNLTKREVEVLTCLQDYPTKSKIAEKLVISQRTVETHIKNIYKKLHVNCSAQAVAVAIKERLI